MAILYFFYGFYFFIWRIVAVGRLLFRGVICETIFFWFQYIVQVVLDFVGTKFLQN